MMTYWLAAKALPDWIVRVFAPVPIVSDVVEVAACAVWLASAANAMFEVPRLMGESVQVCSNMIPALTLPEVTRTREPNATLALLLKSAA